MIRRLLLLIGGSAAFWLLVGLPARAFGGGDRAFVFSGTAVLLCLPPMAVSLVWAAWAQTKSPQEQLIAVMGGTGVRILFVLAGAAGFRLGHSVFSGADGLLALAAGRVRGRLGLGRGVDPGGAARFQGVTDPRLPRGGLSHGCA